MGCTVVVELEVDFGEGAVGQLLVPVRVLGSVVIVVVGAGGRALRELLEGGAIDVGLPDRLPAIRVCIAKGLHLELASGVTVRSPIGDTDFPILRVFLKLIVYLNYNCIYY